MIAIKRCVLLMSGHTKQYRKLKIFSLMAEFMKYGNL